MFQLQVSLKGGTAPGDEPAAKCESLPHAIRRHAKAISKHRHFDSMIILVILLSSLLLVMDFDDPVVAEIFGYADVSPRSRLVRKRTGALSPRRVTPHANAHTAPSRPNSGGLHHHLYFGIRNLSRCAWSLRVLQYVTPASDHCSITRRPALGVWSSFPPTLTPGDYWHQLDFVVVVEGCYSLVIFALGESKGGGARETLACTAATAAAAAAAT